ncbi:carbohydrate porin [Escherichia coli]
MKKINTLPVTLAVIAACTQYLPRSGIYSGTNRRHCGKAVDKALAERQEKMDAAAAKKVDVINEPESADSLRDMAIPFGVKFSGYARYGAHFQSGDQKYVAVDGSYNGASAIGRLGNEGNGGEFQLSKAFKSDNGAIWDVNVMIDHWGDEVNLKKAYAGVTMFWHPILTPYLGWS